MTRLFNQFTQRIKRKALREEMPVPEKILWSKLKGKQFFGFKFRRQYSVGPYIVDFYCAKAKLAIELDGDSHFSDEAQAYDTERDHYLKQAGLKILRFTNKEVRENLYGVLGRIKEELKVEF